MLPDGFPLAGCRVPNTIFAWVSGPLLLRVGVLIIGPFDSNELGSFWFSNLRLMWYRTGPLRVISQAFTPRQSDLCGPRLHPWLFLWPPLKTPTRTVSSTSFRHKASPHIQSPRRAVIGFLNTHDPCDFDARFFGLLTASCFPKLHIKVVDSVFDYFLGV